MERTDTLEKYLKSICYSDAFEVYCNPFTPHFSALISLGKSCEDAVIDSAFYYQPVKIMFYPTPVIYKICLN